MSHWQEGKIDLNCSIEVLQRALLNIRSTWAQSIEVSAQGNLTAKSSYEVKNPKSGMHIVLRMGSGGIRGADIGFKRNADGTWQIHHDYLPDGIRDMQGVVKQAVATMRAKALAQIKKYDIVSDTKFGSDRIIDMAVPLEDISSV